MIKRSRVRSELQNQKKCVGHLSSIIVLRLKEDGLQISHRKIANEANCWGFAKASAILTHIQGKTAGSADFWKPREPRGNLDDDEIETSNWGLEPGTQTLQQLLLYP